MHGGLLCLLMTPFHHWYIVCIDSRWLPNFSRSASFRTYIVDGVMPSVIRTVRLLTSQRYDMKVYACSYTSEGLGNSPQLTSINLTLKWVS